ALPPRSSRHRFRWGRRRRSRVHGESAVIAGLASCGNLVIDRIRLVEAFGAEGGERHIRLEAGERLPEQFSRADCQADAGALVTARVPEARSPGVVPDDRKMVGAERAEPVVVPQNAGALEEREQLDRVLRDLAERAGAD